MEVSAPGQGPRGDLSGRGSGTSKAASRRGSEALHREAAAARLRRQGQLRSRASGSLSSVLTSETLHGGEALLRGTPSPRSRRPASPGLPGGASTGTPSPVASGDGLMPALRTDGLRAFAEPREASRDGGTEQRRAVRAQNAKPFTEEPR